ncbi:MAG: NAD(P)-dependent glycerol-3-phosphate dehydrogenase [Alphaproteobacteria bacterium]|nr:NAD(P)-dependent glycerol-3-phosphate dehydrogenase [Alphaproteobacteria bacterium]
MTTVGILGGGAWGTALAQVAAEGGETILWAREREVIESINSVHENKVFLPGMPLDPTIRATAELSELAACEALLVVTPAQHMRALLVALPRLSMPLILCAKGMEESTMKLMDEVARETQPDCGVAVLSGPTFAHEVAARLPTAVTLAAEDRKLGERLRDRIARPWFRPYLSDDVTGAEIGGAVKNVLAIACGVVEGRGLGQNARAALISRGFAEMTRFGLARGARAETLAGLAGLGDLVLTCSSVSSRNFSLGKGLGEGRSAAQLLADRRTVAEGAFTAPVLERAAGEAGVDMPIVAAVCALLAGEAGVDEVVGRLLSRPLRSEGD